MCFDIMPCLFPPFYFKLFYFAERNNVQVFFKSCEEIEVCQQLGIQRFGVHLNPTIIYLLDLIHSLIHMGELGHTKTTKLRDQTQQSTTNYNLGSNCRKKILPDLVKKKYTYISCP